MKRVLLVVLSLSVILVIAGCGQTDAPVGNEKAQAGSQSTPHANESEDAPDSGESDSKEVGEDASDSEKSQVDPAATDKGPSKEAVKPGVAPKFDDYPAKEVYGGKTAPLKFTEETRMFRTRLLEAAKGPPNFAGRYILTTWGCGTDCLMGGVIDARTGETTSIPFSICCLDMDAPEDTQKVDVRKDSRLVIFNGLLNEEESEIKTHYYLFENGKFTPLPGK